MKRTRIHFAPMKFRRVCAGITVRLLCAAMLLAPSIAAGSREPTASALELTKPGEPTQPRISADRTGFLQTSDGLTLRLTTDLGSVKIVSLESGSAPVVRYAVHIETDARAPLAHHLLDHYSLSAKTTPAGVEITGNLPPQLVRLSGAQFWVQFEIAVPRNYSVEVKTEAGDIETEDIGGIATLATQGGNIRAGRIGNLRNAASERLVARLETEGGHIQVQDVAGDLKAFTAGGHINAGNIAGDAALRSGGGHIRAGQIGGRADLQTDGGNITVGQAGGLVSVRTGGGQIDFGEVRGSVRAQTGGGGIRIMYVSGPMEVESSAGSICLTRVAGTVRAATAGGTITAWINPDAPSSGGTVHLPGLSQLTSGNGDIIVFLPRNLAADIDAVVESGGERRIEADPALALQIQNRGNGPVRAIGALNGGGPPLKLRTTAGKIRLQFLDSEIALRQSLIQEQKERLMDRLNSVHLTSTGLEKSQSWNASELAREAEDRGDWIDRWLNTLETAFLGGIREDPDELQKHLVSAPPPAYPEIARRAGVQGIVRLQVRATKDGRIEVDKILNGSPTLADAAIAAVKQWRVRPFSTGGRPVDVISTVTFNFQLH
ncbi:MAG TPA: TonB family protein [Candidatus Acidoferrum sp.]|nr:TonB family protein [Candidatus Acidoferrum sp.]